MSRKSAWILLGLLALGLALGLYGLSAKSYWDDEYLSLVHARSLGDVRHVLSLQAGNAHPPLYFLLLRLWLAVGGEGESWTRLLSVLLGLPAVVFVFLIGKRLADERTGLLAAGLYTIMPLMLIYDRELRMYSLFVSLACLSLLALLRAMEDQGPAAWMLYALSVFLMLVTHYHGLLVLTAQGLFCLIQALRGPKPVPRLARFGCAAAGGLILFLPFLPAFIQALKTTPAMWQAEANSGLVGLAYLAFSLVLGQTVMPWQWPAIAGAAGAALLLATGLASFRKAANIWILALSFGGVTFLLGPLVSHNMPRYYVFFVPVLCLALASSFWTAPRRGIALGAILLLGASWGASGANYYAGRDFHILGGLDPSREVAEFLAARVGPDDAIIGGTQVLRLYYLPRSGASCPIAPDLDQYLAAHGGLPPTVWLAIYHPVSTERGEAIRRTLMEAYGYRVDDDTRFLRDPHFARKQKFFRKPFAEYRIEVVKLRRGPGP